MRPGWRSAAHRLVARGLTRISVGAAITATVAASAAAASGGSGRVSGSHIGQLVAVSCSSASACTAVGDYTPGFDHPEPAVALAYRWNGTHWSRQHPAAVSGAELRSVSCPSARTCIAVGSAGAEELAETWNGASWTRQPPPDAASGDLLAVSCSSADACTAVGSSAARWNGSAWTGQSISIPSGAYLDGVACPSAKACFAVGGKPNGPNEAVLVERWNGSVWSEQNAPSPKPRSGGPHLSSVSCSTVHSCTAVGSDGYGVLVEHWNGSAWTRQTAPLGHRNAVLDDVSCPSAKRCMAVGGVNFKPLGVLAESWNGARWSLSRALTPNSSRGQGAALFGVSCPPTRVCAAVGAGGDFSDNVERLAVERWTGGRWRLQ